MPPFLIQYRPLCYDLYGLTVCLYCAGSVSCYYCSAPRPALISVYDPSFRQLYVTETGENQSIYTIDISNMLQAKCQSAIQGALSNCLL